MSPPSAFPVAAASSSSGHGASAMDPSHLFGQGPSWQLPSGWQVAQPAFVGSSGGTCTVRIEYAVPATFCAGSDTSQQPTGMSRVAGAAPPLPNLPARQGVETRSPSPSAMRHGTARPPPLPPLQRSPSPLPRAAPPRPAQHSDDGYARPLALQKLHAALHTYTPVPVPPIWLPRPFYPRNRVHRAPLAFVVAPPNDLAYPDTPNQRVR